MTLTTLISQTDSESLSISAGKHLRRELQALLAESEMLIPAVGCPSPVAIHDIRVNMKRCRAILKLLRASPDAVYYSRENIAMRDISALFSSSREADVLKKTLKYMGRKYPDTFSRKLIEWFMSSADEQSAGIMDEDHRATMAKDASGRLIRAWYRIGFLNLRLVNRELLLDGLLNSFIRAEENYHSSMISESPTQVHELRKRVKDLLYQVRFFSDYNPDHFGKLYNELDCLASSLGKCNDLAVAYTFTAESRNTGSIKGIEAAAELLESERKTLFREALPVASHIFSTFYSGD
jgi:CHAD domain-containing protein